MMAGIRNTCIFMLAAQAILFFVPGQSYVKYVRVLAGMMMILQICGPLLGFWGSEGEYEQIIRQRQQMEEEINRLLAKSERKDDPAGIYGSIEKELKSRLASAVTDYEVVQVGLLDKQGKMLREDEGEEPAEKVVIYVRKKQTEKAWIEPVQLGRENKEGTVEGERLSFAEDERLKKLFGECIDVPQQRIEIRVRK